MAPDAQKYEEILFVLEILNTRNSDERQLEERWTCPSPPCGRRCTFIMHFRDPRAPQRKQVGRIDVSAATSVGRYGSCSVLATVDQEVSVPSRRAVSTGFLPTSATWSVTDWRRVIFSDESIQSQCCDHRTRVWRRTGQRSDPAFIVASGIQQFFKTDSWDTRSSLVVLQGTLTARRYVDDILTPIVLPMLSSRPGAIYQQDNARPHTARLSQQCLQGYDVLPWPATSFANRTGMPWEGNCSRPEIQEN
ncbi:transposable element Tc1 transposase [Trichonephila clavipes]|nr:transposable element Tc1 transposase [Trichonephila clavipes]